MARATITHRETETETMTTYRIETRPANSICARAWTADGIGDQNAFATEAEAAEAIADLRALGDGWAAAQYRVVSVHDWIGNDVAETDHGAISYVCVVAIREEAGAAGDLAQVAVCDRALDGDHLAITECARVLYDAAAQD